MSRTTLTIDDDLIQRLKEIAAQRGQTMGNIVNDLLRHAITHPAARRSFKLQLNGWKAEMQPGVDILDRDKLFELMDDR